MAKRRNFLFIFLASFTLLSLFLIIGKSVSAADDTKKVYRKLKDGTLKEVPSAKPVNPQANKFEIKLQSRRFTPAQEDITTAIQSFVQTSPKDKVHVLMQFQDIPDVAQRQILENAQVKLLNYIPDKAWFVSVPKGMVQAQITNANVRWLGPILPEDKIFPPILNRGVSSWATNPDGSVNLEVTFFEDVPLTEAREIMLGMGAVIKEESEVSNRLTVTVPSQRLLDIANEDAVRWIIEERPPKKAFNDGARANVGANTVQAAPYGLSGLGVDVGIWDEGQVDSAHDDFGSRLTLADTSNPVSDHSTHVAGTMGGSGALSAANGGSALQWRGMAPQMDIFSYDWDESLDEHSEAIKTYGIEISQNSWGYNLTVPPQPELYGYYVWDASIYDDIVTSRFGKRISVVFAAGNDRNDVPPPYGEYDTIGPPATAKNIICVGAINSDDDSMTVFSGWGPMDDGRIKPDVVAPGDEVGGDFAIRSTFPGDTYGLMAGTSMAAPGVSGCASLLIEDFRSLYSGQDPLPSTVKALLIHQAKDLGNTGPDYSFGYGGIQIQGAIDKLRAKSLQEDEVGNANTDTYSLYVPPGATDLKVTLVWDDDPATEGALVTLVNDLDLIVKDPNNIRYYPWTLDPANPSVSAVRTQEDHINNIEQVAAGGSITSGFWTIEVKGFNVPIGPQKYSLIFTPNYGTNVIGNLYKNSAYTQEEKFFDRSDTVYIEARATTSSGAPLTGATVNAVLKLSNGTTVATVSLTDAGSGYYRNSWDSAVQAADVYSADISVVDPPLNTREYFHLYPQSGVSGYRLDYNKDGNNDYILENKRLVAAYNGRANTNESLLSLLQKDTDTRYNFSGISNNDTKGAGEVTTTNLKGIKFYSFTLPEGENLTSLNFRAKADVTKLRSGQSCMFDDDATATGVFDAIGCKMRANFTDTTAGTLEFWARSQSQTENDSFDIMLENGTTIGPDIYFLFGEIGYWNGDTNTIMHYTPGQWYHFKVVFSCVSGTMDIYIDDMTTPKVTGAGFWNGLLSINRIELDTGQWLFGLFDTFDYFDPLVYVDDIQIYSGPTTLLTDNFEDDTAGSNPGSPWVVTEDSAQTNVAISNTVYYDEGITTTFDFSSQMKTEEVDYLVYKLSGFDANIDDIVDIFSPISGSFGEDVTDDRYHIGNGTDNPVNSLSSGAWTNFSALTDPQKYVAIYDNSLASDAVNDNVISWVHFPNASTLSFQDMGLWYEAGKGALRIRYDTTSGTGANQAEYLLAFTKGDYSKIEQWMTTIAVGTYPAPNFMTFPSLLGVSVSPNTWPIGLIGASQFSRTTEANDITVTNTGSVNETFTLNIASGGTTWFSATTPGVDAYVMQGLFCGASDAPAAGLFGIEDIILLGSPDAATATKFGDATLSANGVNIVPSGTRDLWFQFQAPASTSDNTQQTINVTVGAEQF